MGCGCTHQDGVVAEGAPRAADRPGRLAPPTAVRGETGEDPALRHQREGADARRPGPCLGVAGRETRGHRQERPRSPRQTRLGLFARTARPSLRVLPGKL